MWEVTATGMDQATYDQSAPGLHEMVKKQPGFIIHVGVSVARRLDGGRGLGQPGAARIVVQRTRTRRISRQRCWMGFTTEYIQLHALVQP